MHFVGQYCGLMHRCFIPKKTKEMDSKTHEKQRQTHEIKEKLMKTNEKPKKDQQNNN